MSGYSLESGVVDSGGRSIITLNGGVDASNTTVVALGAGAVFTGTGVDTSYWGSLIVTCHVDVASATDGLELQWSPDNSTWFTADTFTIAANACKIFTFMPVGRYYRVKYTNGGTPQGAFYLCSQWRSTSVKGSSHRIQDSISDEDDAELTKSILTAQQADGHFENVEMDYTGALNVAYGDSANLDAFSRLRTSTPDTVFDSSFQYDLQPLIYQALTANSGTIAHSANTASATLSTAAVASSSAILQSKGYHRYIPGKGQLVLMTGVFGTAVANISKKAGYFDDNDGIFYEQNGTSGVRIVKRTSTSGSPADTTVNQANWNIDTLLGTGGAANPSGITLDPTKGFILVMDLQWLGLGRVRIGFDIGGRIIPVHQFTAANADTAVYIKTANLPVRWEISGNGVASMSAVCASVQSEGGADKFLGYQFSYNRAVVTAGNGTQTYAFSIRPKATFNSITNRMLLRPTSFETLVTGNYPVLTEIYYNTTVGGAPSWADVDATFSALQVDTAGTPSGGVKVASFWTGATTAASATRSAVEKFFTARYPLTLDIAGTGYTNMTVYVQAAGGTSTCYPGVSWEETR